MVSPQVTNGRGFPVLNPYPWVAGIFETRPGEDWKDFACSGTLISSQFVVTTADCITSTEVPVTTAGLRIAIGIRDWANISSNDWRTASQVWVHPSWKRSTGVADVALIRLTEPTSIQPIDVLRSDLPAGTSARIAGWGPNQTGQGSTVLQWGDVQVISGPQDSYCRDLNVDPSKGPVFRPEWMMCALGTDLIAPADACDGDQGGPLMVQQNGSWTLAGVAAWVDTCADFYEPATYARLTAALPWLDKQMANPDVSACGVAESVPFLDIRQAASYRKAVGCLTSREILATNPLRRFDPLRVVDRAQMATLLWRMSGQPNAPDHQYVDEKTIPSWARNATDWLHSVGLTTIDPYRPNVAVTRGQTATFLWRLAGSPPSSTECGFLDVEESRHFAQAVCWLKAEGLTTGWGGNLSFFAPQEGVSRGQMATFLYRYGLNKGLWFNLE